MALSPHLLSEIIDNMNLAFPGTLRRCPVLNPNLCLGNGFDHDYTVIPSRFGGRECPWRQKSSRNCGALNIHNTGDGLKVNLDVQQFKPEEITVKIVDKDIIVEGQHEERQDNHGYISRQFKRRYTIPDDVDVDAVVSRLSSDGVLSITAPKKVIKQETSKERVIQIFHTNAPAVTSTPQAAQQETTEETQQTTQQKTTEDITHKG